MHLNKFFDKYHSYKILIKNLVICLVDNFNSEKFSPCPIKCIPIQMKGFKYVNDSKILAEATYLEEGKWLQCNSYNICIILCQYHLKKICFDWHC